MANSTRERKVADRIQQTVARLLEKRLKDPRIGFVTITDVRLTGDLQHATIFYTVYGSQQELELTQKALQSAMGFIRSEVGKDLGIRLTPTLEFCPDSLPETAAQLEQALEAAKAHDAQVAQLAAQASYAGDQDPYKKPATDDATDADEAQEFAEES